MDIRSRKSSKLAKFIIALVVLVPAFLLVALYPRMERLMLQSQGEKGRDTYTEDAVYNPDTDYTPEDAFNYLTVDKYILSYNFVNYVVESSYYLYGKLLQEAENREVNFDILDNFGWINDFYNVSRENEYFAIYTGKNGKQYTDTNSYLPLETLLTEGTEISERVTNELARNGIRGYLTMGFDPYGKFSEIEFVSLGRMTYQVNLYETARESLAQFENNEAYYMERIQYNGIDAKWAQKASEVVPKNFKIVFAIPANSSFIYNNASIVTSMYSYYQNSEMIFWDMGIFIVVLILAGFVAFMALILPFFKRLNTGWEKLFCVPIEIVLGLSAFGVIGTLLMSKFMCHSTLSEVALSWKNAAILGYVVSNESVYYLILGINYVGWTLIFLAEYIVVSAFRQFISHPIQYLKERLLVVMIIRWIGVKGRKFFDFMTDVDLSDTMQKGLLRFVLLNFGLIAAMCCGWFIGIPFAIVYSVVLYHMLKQRGKQMQKQYKSILHATEQMAEGELKISLPEDLGVFEQLGNKLEQVQEGFSKAVAAEAKSQHMKTELISNVSHDLKTPLTAIITYVDLLKREGNTTEQQKSYIHTLEMKAQRLKILIEDLFEVSKAQSGNIQLNKMDVDVVSLMKQLRLEMEDKIADSDLLFRWNLPEEKVVLSLDGQKTYRIFENLLTNVLKYAMPGSRVFVDIINSETQVQIVYKNVSSIELNSETEQLTERFVRGDASRNSEGSGLGLAIVKSFAEVQGGDFRIEVDGDLFKAILTWKK